MSLPPKVQISHCKGRDMTVCMDGTFHMNKY